MACTGDTFEMMHTPQVPSNSESAINTDRICNDQDQGHSIHSHAEPVSTCTDSHNNIPDTRIVIRYGLYDLKENVDFPLSI